MNKLISDNAKILKKINKDYNLNIPEKSFNIYILVTAPDYLPEALDYKCEGYWKKLSLS